MKLSIMKATLVTVTLGLLGTTGFFWHSMRDVYGTFSSYSVDIYHSRILQAQKLETLLREGSVDEALALLQRNRDSAVVQLGQMRPHIDAATWRMGRDQFIIDKLDSAMNKEVEYRLVNGQTSSRLADQARNVLESYEE